MDDFNRTLLKVCVAVSLGCIGLVAYWMVVAYQADASSCALLGTAGEASVSWFPPGTVCTYGEASFVDRPSYLRVPVLLIALGGIPFCWWMRRSLRPRR